MRPSDARDMQNFYLEYYEKNIQALFKFLEDNRYFEGTYVVYLFYKGQQIFVNNNIVHPPLSLP